MRSRRERCGHLQLILKILAHFFAVDPEFHALGDSIEGIASCFEREAAAYGFAARGSADIHAELVGWWRSTVDLGTGVPQNESSATLLLVRRIPGYADIVARVAVDVTDEGEISVLAPGGSFDCGLKSTIAIAEHVTGVGFDALVAGESAAGQNHVIQKIAVQVPAGNVVVRPGSVGSIDELRG